MNMMSWWLVWGKGEGDEIYLFLYSLWIFIPFFFFSNILADLMFSCNVANRGILVNSQQNYIRIKCDRYKHYPDVGDGLDITL